MGRTKCLCILLGFPLLNYPTLLAHNPEEGNSTKSPNAASSATHLDPLNRQLLEHLLCKALCWVLCSVMRQVRLSTCKLAYRFSRAPSSGQSTCHPVVSPFLPGLPWSVATYIWCGPRFIQYGCYNIICGTLSLMWGRC